MTTTTPSTPSTPKRPTVLILAAALMLLAAVLTFATPFLPRVGGFGGVPPVNGQAPGAGRATAGQDIAPGQNGTPGGAPGQGNPPSGALGQGNPPSGALGFGAGRTGSASGVMNFMLPVRIGEAVLGGLCALLAALGLWRLRKWGRNLALAVAVVSLISAVVTLVSPLLGRNPWLSLLTSSTWQAIAGLSLTLGAAILALLPAARRAYVVKPKVRRVM